MVFVIALIGCGHRWRGCELHPGEGKQLPKVTLPFILSFAPLQAEKWQFS